MSVSMIEVSQITIPVIINVTNNRIFMYVEAVSRLMFIGAMPAHTMRVVHEFPRCVRGSREFAKDYASIHIQPQLTSAVTSATQGCSPSQAP